jgi:hypothetical protein
MALTKVSYSLINSAAANIVDFGADPTGVNDSSAAILAAMNASDNVYVPGNSIFKLASNLNVPRAGITFFGDGPTSQISFSGNNRRIICNEDRFTMRDLLINGNKPNVGWETTNNYDFGLRVGDGVSARVSDIRVLNVIFKDIGLDGIYIDNCEQVLINDGCQFINCRRWGIVLDGGTYGTSFVTINAQYFDCNYATGPLGKVYPLGAIDLEPYDTNFNCNWCVVDGAVCNYGDIRVVPSAPGTVTNTTIKNCTVIEADIRVFGVDSDVVIKDCNILSSGNNAYLSDYVADSLPTQATISGLNIKNGRAQKFQTNGRANWLPQDYISISNGSISTNGVGSYTEVPMNIDGNLVNVSKFSGTSGTTPVQAVDLATTASIATNDLVFLALQVDRTDNNADEAGTWLRALCGPIDRRVSLAKGKGQWVVFSVYSDGAYNNPSATIGLSASGALSASVEFQINRAFLFINPKSIDLADLVAEYVPVVGSVSSYTGPTLDAYNKDFLIVTAGSAQNIDTINGGVVGKRLSLTTASGNAVTLRDTSASSGNIKLISGTSFVLDQGASTNAITLLYHSDDYWYQVT